MSKNKWKYNVSASWEQDGKKHSFATQLYMIGVYIIFDSNSTSQGSITPNTMEKLCKRLNKDYNENKISNLEFGMTISVIEENKVYKEINE
jgi:hypothetical protein